ncbi:MAG TPA: hypothetical protein PKG67_01240 [Turneriella sp.]|nr:hypothetical protein [Turneriella sp.]HNM99037.1 hypothetical protein [Turneriella sp.]
MTNWQTMKKSFLTGVFFTLGIVTTAIVAVTVSATFTSGDTLTAANMNVLKTAIESIPDWTKSGSDAVFTGGNVQIGNGSTSRDLAVYGKVSSTALGTFCGVTASTYDGTGVGGWAGGKTKCEVACGDTRAHMCTEHEFQISAQLGIDFSPMASSDHWYAANMSEYTAPSQQTSNCGGWTSNNSAAYSRTVTQISGRPSSGVTACNAARRISCCR